MSTRKGEVKILEEILDAAKETMLGVMMSNETKYKGIKDPDHVSDQVGMSAVKIQDLQARRYVSYLLGWGKGCECRFEDRIMSYDFDWKRMTSFEGDTGWFV